MCEGLGHFYLNVSFPEENAAAYAVERKQEIERSSVCVLLLKSTVTRSVHYDQPHMITSDIGSLCNERLTFDSTENALTFVSNALVQLCGGGLRGGFREEPRRPSPGALPQDRRGSQFDGAHSAAAGEGQ